jgi:hypothetical protein
VKTNGRRTGILSDGTRVNAYRYGDEWTAALHYPDGGYSALVMIGDTAEFDEHNLEGPHMGTLMSWEAVPASIKRDIEHHAVESSMVANGISLTEADKRVVRAFVDERSADSRLLDTDGVKLDKMGLGGETVAKWIGGRIAIVSTESAKSDETIIRAIIKVAGPGIVDYSYARKGHRVHEHGAMGRNGIDWERSAVVEDIERDFSGTTMAGEHPDTEVHIEHGQPWVTCLCGASWSVVDTSRGLDYERIDEGDDGYHMERNGRATTVDPVAARELDLYIANTYELIGAPNSIGKSIDTNLKRKLASGKYDPALAPKAWQYLVDQGAKRYEKEFGSDSPIFNAATRRQVAADFARAWESENGMTPNARRQIPEYLQGYEDFSNEDFYNELLSKGYTHTQARLQAKRASHAIGKLDFLPPRAPAGWTLGPDPIWHRRTGKVAFEAHKGAKYLVLDAKGEPISPELRGIRGLIEWRGANGYIDGL